MMVGISAPRAQDASSEPTYGPREDPAKIMTSEACGECHVAEYEVWKKTPHATGFKTLHRKASAEAIRDRLGLRLIKRDSPCIACHYTPFLKGGQLRADSGVSCESCHGAGRDWINVHNDYGGKGFDHKNETQEHRTMRIEESVRLGMRRPSDLYPVVKSCFACHTVPDERLVNVGGHSIGSGDFEFVAWSQGEIRHNFLDSFLNGDGTENAERPSESKRRMYVAGRAAALEYALRGVAAAKEDGLYLKAMQRRVRSAVTEIRAIGRRAELPEIDAMVATVKGVEVGLGHETELLAAAEAIDASARRFLDRHDGVALASLDALVLGLEDELLEEDETEIAEDRPGGTDPLAAPGDPSASPVATPSDTTSSARASPGTSTASSSTAGSRSSGAVPAVGEFKRRLHAPSRFKTLGPGACNRCHAAQNEWWFSDAHFRSADPFFDEAPQNVRIARLYGLKPSQMTRGDHICMDCHGSIISGREKRVVQDGVGCESCHGPAADFLEPHQEGEKSQGVSRPGYVAALKLGMNELKNLEVRARTCTGCHYITEPRLISAGHPSGAGFDYAGGMETIRHWEGDAQASAVQTAFTRVLGERGPVPKVQLARLATSAPQATAATAATAAAEERPPGPAELQADFRPRPRGRSGTPSANASPTASSSVPLPTGAFDAPPVGDLDLPPFPDIESSTSVEEILLLIKKRLDLLYRKLYQEGGSP